jgi:hypothetical protein
VSERALRALVEAPSAVAAWPETEWDRLVRDARRSNLLGRIAARLERAGELDRVAAPPRQHLRATLNVVRAQHDEMRREARLLANLLAPLGVPTLLLKGAAYVVGGHAAALGRLSADIDVLVPRPRLAEVEAALMLAGWVSTHHSAYDQRYYREWMHELPPMRHIARGTTLDVHHAIVPLTARLRPDSGLLQAAAVPLGDDPRMSTLSPPDLVLHSATHLFQNEEFAHGLRDLSDLDLLLRDFGTDAAFWPLLLDRAEALGLQRPLHYGLRFARRLLGTPVPAAAAARAEAWAPSWPAVMDALWQRAFTTAPADHRPAFTGAARTLLMVRGHWLKMPPAMLVRHLATKPFRRPEKGAA